MRQAIAVAGVVLLLLAGWAGLPGSAAPGTNGAADETTQNILPSVAQQSGAAGSACDYASLYDRTIDSVVAIRADGGLGSGFVYGVGGADGAGTSYVVTNAHVVGQADTVRIQFSREETRTGTVVGRDRYSDLAVIRVDGTPEYVDALSVADTAPQHGVKVAALGNPFGLEETITHGIVSGLNRSLPTEQGFSIPNVVQTDAAISPGNSGGPLITCEGTVVGVNSAGIAARGAENIAFAISPTMVNRVVPAIIQTGEYEHAYLGVRTAAVTPALSEANGFGSTSGLYVHEVVPGGPASGVLQGSTGTTTVAGTEVPVGGDLIVAIDGRPIVSGEDLSSYLATETRPGTTVTLTVVRDGQRQQVQMTMGERPEPTPS